MVINRGPQQRNSGKSRWNPKSKKALEIVFGSST